MKKDKDLYLFRRPENGVWYFRRPIPKELQPFIVSGNRRVISVSLETSVLNKEARERHRELLFESERILEEARKRKAVGARGMEGRGELELPTSRELVSKRPFGKFSRAELMGLLHDWFLREQQGILERFRFTFSFGDEEERRNALAELDAELASLGRREGAKPDFEVFRALREMVEDAGGSIAHVKRGEEMELHLWFMPLVREALIRLNHYARAILETGSPPIEDGPLPEFRASQFAAHEGMRRSVSLDELIERFEHDPNRQDVKPKTRDEFQLVYAMLREFIGGKTPIASITRDQIKELQSVYRNLPKFHTRRYRGKTLREAAELGKREGAELLERSTFNKRMTLLGAIFSFAVTEHLLASSPAKN